MSSAGGSALTTDRWRQIDAIFAGALTLQADERAEVEELLAAADSADSYFDAIRPRIRVDDLEGGPDAGAGEPGGELDDPDDAFGDRAGELVGPYRLVRPIGEGGMGAVYLAERADGQFEQRVAIKLVHAPRIRASGLIQRFLRERQILARLQHPNIARLLDGGVTDDGQPYLVMEYVEGLPITEYARAHGLPVDERIRLLMKVGEAVQHAHRSTAPMTAGAP